MATGPEVPGWAYVLGGGFAGTAVKAVFDFLKVRYRQATGERRQSRKDELTGFGALVDRLESRLTVTEQKADAAEARARDCDQKHAVCTAQLVSMKSALNQALEKLHLPRVAEDHVDG